MLNKTNRWRGIAAAAVSTILAGLATGCADQSDKPTPVATRAPDSPVPTDKTGFPGAGTLVSSSPSKPRFVIVAHGQSLNSIAHSQHVLTAALAAANQLKPPYKLKIGLQLRLPDAAGPPVQQARAASVTSAAPLAPSLPPPPSQEPQKATAPAPLVSLDGPSKGTTAPQSPQNQAQDVPHLPAAPPVLPPRNPAAALPLPGEAP